MIFVRREIVGPFDAVVKMTAEPTASDPTSSLAQSRGRQLLIFGEGGRRRASHAASAY